MIDFSHNIKEMNKKFQQYAGALKQAQADALNDTMALCRTSGDKQVREEYNIKAADLKKKVSLFKATRANPTSILKLATYRSGGKSRGSNLPLYYFGAKQEANGVSFQIKRGGARVFIKHAMIMTTRSGHTGIFIRGTRDGKGHIKFSPYIGKGILGGKSFKSGKRGTINSFIEQYSENKLKKMFGGMRGAGVDMYSLPSNELYSYISIEQMYTQAFPVMRRLAEKRFPDLYEHAIKYRTGKL